MKELVFLFFSILLVSCGLKSNKTPTIDVSKFDDINRIETKIKNDTVFLDIFDESYIYFDEYVTLRLNYLIWNNIAKFDFNQPIKISIYHHGGEVINHLVTYNNYELNKIKSVYQNNNKFDTISNIILSDFTPTEIMNIRNANNYLNEEFQDYKNDFTNLFYDLSLCQDSCFAYNRIKTMTKMFDKIKLEDFWVENKRIPADEMVKKINLIFTICTLDTLKL